MEYYEEGELSEFESFENIRAYDPDVGLFRFTILDNFEYKGSATIDEPNILNWQKTPRSPSNFTNPKFSESSIDESIYEAWLDNYYEELRNEEKRKKNVDRETDTFDLRSEDSVENVTSLFQEVKKDIGSFRSKYWGPHDVRRHWPLRKNLREYLYFPAIHPHLNLRSRYGRFHSLLNSAEAVPEVTYKKTACTTIKKVVENLESTKPQLHKILVCDNLINFRFFDAMTKVTVLRCICRFLKTQTSLDKIYFENAKIRRMEGIIILCALSKNASSRLTELHIWNYFGPGENPLLLNSLSLKGKSEDLPASRGLIHIHYLQILCYFTALTHLSINYAYLANRTGDAILYIKSVTYGRLKELRILCLESERPFRTNPSLGTGGWRITDGVWRRVAELCPDLRVKLVFMNMPEYENIILFLSKDMPVSSIYISSEISLQFQKPWDLDSTLLTARDWYAHTLESLSLHLWHHRDLFDFIIKNKILDEFPNLIIFEFIGILEDVNTLLTFCTNLSKGHYKLKTLLFWVEVTYTNRKKRFETQEKVKQIREDFRKRFQEMDIDADIDMYSL